MKRPPGEPHGDLRCVACIAFDAAERAAIQGTEMPPHALAVCTCEEPMPSPPSADDASLLAQHRAAPTPARLDDSDEPIDGTITDEPTDGTIMIPRWLVQANAQHGAAYGVLLVYGVLLLFAADHHLDEVPRTSYCNALTADVARRLGLTPSYVRRVLHDLERLKLIQRDGDFTLFCAHPWMGAATAPEVVTFLDVEGRWATDAFYLPATIARLRRRELGTGEKVFFAVLRRYEKRRWGVIAAKQRTLGLELGIGDRQVQKFVAKLKAKGLLDVEDRRRYRRANVMRTHVRTPLAGKTGEGARAESSRQRASRGDT